MWKRARTKPYREAKLTLHPSSSKGPTFGVSVEYWRDGRYLLVRFITDEDNDWIAWPAPTSSERSDELWRTTCFEVFVATGEGYREYNLSPSSQWASYRFDSYRAGMTAAPETVVSKGIRFQDYIAILEAQIELPDGACRLGFSTVLQTAEGTMHYWALAHPSDKPDFHHPDSFVLDIP